MEPCYKKFTIIISKARAKRKHSTEDVLESGQVKQRRYQRMSLGVNLFPDYCYFCKKKRKTVKGKVQICHRLTLKATEETIKEAAELRNDKDVLRDIRDRKNDLILIMTPEKQDKTLELSKHWSVDSTPARNEVIMKRTYTVKSVKCDKICSNY